MNTLDEKKYYGSFPAQYRSQQLLEIGCQSFFYAPFLIVAGLLVICGCYLLVNEPSFYAFFIASVGLGLLWLLAKWMSIGYREMKIARIVPYFTQRMNLEEIDFTFNRGEALARHCRELDELCIERAVRTISSFGFADDYRAAEPSIWHSATDGLNTVTALLGAPLPTTDTIDAGAILEDLQRLSKVLELAAARGIEFCFHLRQGTDRVVSPLEFDLRRGFYW